MSNKNEQEKKGFISRRKLLVGGGALAAVAAAVVALRHKLINKLSALTQLESFTATPPLKPHHPEQDKTTIYVASGDTPAKNIDKALEKMGGIGRVVAPGDLVLIKVSAQWWNQGMTNVAAVRRVIERILALPGFSGEIVVFENTHFRMKDGSGLSRAWKKSSERNVDVQGWTCLGDLIDHFEKERAPVSFVGLVDGAENTLSKYDWHDKGHSYGVYGGDGRGPIASGETRDGYVWDLGSVFEVKKSLVEYARTPLSWPVFSSGHSKKVIDFKRGVFKREGHKLVAVKQSVKWINMTTANEHSATGFTGCCKSAMGVVDMSAGRFGTHPAGRGFLSTHYFGSPNALWRMAGPLAYFAKHVRKPDLYITVAEWVGAMPEKADPSILDLRISKSSAHRKRTVVAGKDPVAIDSWCVRNLLMPIAGANKKIYDLDDQNSKVVKFLRNYREVYGKGTLDEKLVTVERA